MKMTSTGFPPGCSQTCAGERPCPTQAQSTQTKRISLPSVKSAPCQHVELTLPPHHLPRSANVVALGDAFELEAIGETTFAGIFECNIVTAGAMTAEVLDICEAQRGDNACEGGAGGGRV